MHVKILCSLCRWRELKISKRARLLTRLACPGVQPPSIFLTPQKDIITGKLWGVQSDARLRRGAIMMAEHAVNNKATENTEIALVTLHENIVTMWNGRNCTVSLISWALIAAFAHGFAGVNLGSNRRASCITSLRMASGQGFGGATTAPEKEKTATKQDLNSLSTMQIKDKLLTLLPSMMGTDDEFRLVEQYVNALEEAYVPAQTLDFLNLAMSGEWQLLFSTNLSGGPRPNFRLRELLQKVESKGLEGTVTNVALWDFAEDESTFDATGTFSVKCGYTINQGARMVMELQDHVLNPFPGSKIPADVPALVGMLHRSMPKEMFDPNEHAMDTTYLDGDLRIVRMTGPRLEGVRDIFVRRGSIEIDPTAGGDS